MAIRKKMTLCMRFLGLQKANVKIATISSIE